MHSKAQQHSAIPASVGSDAGRLAVDEASLGDSLQLGSVQVRNRIWLAPMCQYSVTAEDGVPGDWHLVTLGSKAAGGFGLVMTEATAVSPEGRISPQDTGIWNAAQESAWTRIANFIGEQGATPAIQLAHAGRKASTYRGFPGEQRGALEPSAGGWQPLGPEDIAFDGLTQPRAMCGEDFKKVIQDFADAAERSVRAGFQVLEIHAAHGYLLHEFLSPLTNHRTDHYGGSLEKRYRLLSQVINAVQQVIPSDIALIVRVSATDWHEDGLHIDDMVTFCQWMRTAGVDLIDVSTGGNALVPIPVGPGYQVPHASYIRDHANIKVSAVGMITSATQAQQVVRLGQADAVMIGRQALVDSSWALKALLELDSDHSQSLVPPALTRGHW